MTFFYSKNHMIFGKNSDEFNLHRKKIKKISKKSPMNKKHSDEFKKLR